MPGDSPYPPIRDYGAIGDCRTIALVSRTASIDWWCPPRFDAPALFGRLLDWRRGGSLHFAAERLTPAGRRYLPGSAVLETTLELEGGSLVVTDFLALVGRPGPLPAPVPFARQKLVRLVRCERGRVRFALHCVPRPGYGRVRPRLWLAGPPEARRRALTLLLPRERRRVTLCATIDWAPIHDAQGRLEAVLGPGEELGVVIDHGAGDLAGEGVEHPGEHRAQAFGRLFELDELHRWRDETLQFWSGWAAVSRYGGPYRDLVQRSAITLKLLTYHPSGAIVAAGTTSLPEEPGGERNWDYRYTWLRDASFTLYALHALGYRAEADAFMDWLAQACVDDREPSVLYRVDGSTPGRECILRGLDGYRQARPVRIGNRAARQLQLDIYGEVLDAAWLDARAGNRFGAQQWALVARFADFAAQRWRLPDNSIWEVRGPQRHFTYSKVMCWVALDRACRLAVLLGHAEEEAQRLERWRSEAAVIRETVLREGRRADGAFVQSFGSTRLDAACLVFPLVGFIDAGAPSARATLAAVHADLAYGPLVRRYRNNEAIEGVSGGEAFFLICSYWLCDNLALRGEVDEARRRFEALSAHANDLGLFSEQWAPRGELALGNFPQAFTHIALIGSAYNLERAARGSAHGAVRATAPGG